MSTAFSEFLTNVDYLCRVSPKFGTKSFCQKKILILLMLIFDKQYIFLVNKIHRVKIVLMEEVTFEWCTNTNLIVPTYVTTFIYIRVTYTVPVSTIGHVISCGHACASLWSTPFSTCFLIGTHSDFAIISGPCINFTLLSDSGHIKSSTVTSLMQTVVTASINFQTQNCTKTSLWNLLKLVLGCPFRGAGLPAR